MSFNASKWLWKVSDPNFPNLGLATKMALQVDSSNFFHPESTKIDEKLYDDPIQITMCNDPKPLCKDHHCFGVF
jgi:hypothetical protein